MRELGCSRGYIYKVLKERNLKVESVSRRVKRLRNVDVAGIDIVHL
jgi:hypothetical protein